MTEDRTRRRWLSRPRSMWKGFVVSLALHLALAGTFVGVWHLLPLPPMRPIRISILKHAPSRQDLGLTPDGRLPEDRTP